MLRLVNKNVTRCFKCKQLGSFSSFRFNSTEKNSVQNAEAPNSPANAKADVNHTPQQMTQLTPLYKYLVYKFSSTKYASVKDVPDLLPSAQVNFAKDKGRAYMTIVGIGITILGSLVAVIVGKRDHRKGIKHTDDIIKQHSEYSKAHQEMLKKKESQSHV